MSESIGIIVEEEGKILAAAFNVSKLRPIEDMMPKPIAGPFLLEATVVEPLEGKLTSEVAMFCAIGQDDLHIMMPRLPIIMKSGEDFDYELGPTQKFFEANTKDGVETKMFTIDARSFPNGDMFYFHFHRAGGKTATCCWDTKQQTAYSVPFYNFHTDGTSCLGSSTIGAQTPFQKLLGFINAYTTPHNTFSQRTGDKFNLNGKDELLFNGKKGKWPEQKAQGWVQPPDCLKTEAARNAVLGKLTPLV